MSSQYCMQLEMITDENIYGTVTNHHKKGTAIEKKKGQEMIDVMN